MIYACIFFYVLSAFSVCIVHFDICIYFHISHALPYMIYNIQAKVNFSMLTKNITPWVLNSTMTFSNIFLIFIPEIGFDISGDLSPNLI